MKNGRFWSIILVSGGLLILQPTYAQSQGSTSPNSGSAAAQTSTGSPEKDWTSALQQLHSSETLYQALGQFIGVYKSQNTPRVQSFLNRAQHLQEFMTSADINYQSLDDLDEKIGQWASENSDPLELQTYLVWLGDLATELLRVEPHNSTYDRLKQEVGRLLSLGEASTSEESLLAYMDRSMHGRLIEQHKLEVLLKAKRTDSDYAHRLYASYKEGGLTKTMRRLMLGQFLDLRSLSVPVMRKEPQKVLQKSLAGSRFQVERVTEFENPDSFLREGQKVEDDFLNMTMGTLYRRQNYRPRMIEHGKGLRARRSVVLLTDVSPSMYDDERWKMRNELMASYLDRAFSMAQAKGEELTVWFVPYDEKIREITVYKNLRQVEENYDDILAMKLSGEGTNHTRGLVDALEEVLLKSDQAPTHLNLFMITDGEGSIDVNKVKGQMERFQGTKVNFSVITMIEGGQSFVKLTDSLENNPTLSMDEKLAHRHFDKSSVRQWLSDQWILQRVNGKIGNLSQKLQVSAYAVMNLQESIRRLQVGLNDILAVPQISIPGEKGAISSETTDDQQATPAGGSNAKDSKDMKDSKNIKNAKDSKDMKDAKDAEPSENAKDTNGNKNSNELKHQSPEKPSPSRPDQELAVNKSHDPLNLAVDQFSELSGQLAFTITKLQGPRPSILFITREHNVSEAGTNNVSMRLSPFGDPDLVLRSEMPLVVQDGIIPLVTPDGYRMTNLSLMTMAGQPLKGFEVLENQSNGIYFGVVNIQQIPNGTRVKMVASFDFDRRKKLQAKALLDLDKTILSKLSADLDAAGASELSEELQKLIRTKTKIAVNDIEHVFVQTGYYTYLPAEGEMTGDSKSPFTPFSPFLKEGIFHYQCSCANSLMAQFFGEYFREKGELFSAETLDGFVVPRLGSVVSQSGAHRIVSIGRSDQALNYRRLDGTPIRFDKNSPKPPQRFDIPRLRSINKQAQSVLARLKKIWIKHYQRSKAACSAVLKTLKS